MFKQIWSSEQKNDTSQLFVLLRQRLVMTKTLDPRRPEPGTFSLSYPGSTKNMTGNEGNSGA